MKFLILCKCPSLVLTPAICSQQILWEETKLLNEVFLGDGMRNSTKSRQVQSDDDRHLSLPDETHNAIPAFLSHYKQSKMGLNYQLKTSEL